MAAVSTPNSFGFTEAIVNDRLHPGVSVVSTITRPVILTPPSPGDLYRFTVDQYDRMIRDGTISEDEPVELLDGIVVRKMPKGPRHEASAARCRRVIERMLPEGWHLRIEGSVRIPDYDEPEPDLCIVRGESDHYTDHHPGPGDAVLIIEVADGSLSRDRGEKQVHYARAGIPAYWIVNLVDRQVEVSSTPLAGAYPPASVLAEGDAVALVIDGRDVGQIPVADLLPKRD
jgi:Uma2 family endonuclease